MTMKTRFAFALLTICALLFAALPVEAQNAGTWKGLTTTTVGGTLPGSTNNIVANTTNTMAVRIDVPGTENVYLQTSFKLISGAGTSDVEFRLVPGTESSYATNVTAIHKFNVAASGTTVVVGATNIAVGAVPYLWVVSAGHNNSTAVTNLTFSYGFKR